MRRLRKTTSQLVLASFLTAVLCGRAAAQATDITSSQRDTFGEIGMLDMPSARMAPDGQLALSAGGINAGERIALSFQALPWLETSVRYSRVPKLDNGRTLYDRSFGMKVRLFRETPYTPDISFGIRDLIGTGVYSSEYLVMTKRIGAVDVTTGLGWGRLSENGTFRNPFGMMFHSFYKRKAGTPTGGTPNFGQYLHGPDMGVFGGLIWHTPIRNLNLLIEYSSDDYTREVAAGTLKHNAPVNIGLTYTPLDGTSLTAGWFYGSTFGAIATLHFNPKYPSSPGKLGPRPPQPVIRPESEQARAITRYVTGHEAEQPDDAERDAILPPAAPVAPLVAPSATRLANALGAASDVEIDGRTLLVTIHASGHSADFCHSYAQLARNLDMSLVAVTDLDDAAGHVAFCDVPQTAQTAGPTAFMTSFSDDAPADEGGTKAKAGVPADDSGTKAKADATADDAAADTAAERKIRRDAKAQSLRIDAISIGSSDIEVYYTNHRYEIEDAAIGRLVRVLMADAPPRIEVFRLTPLLFGVPTQEVTVLRSPMERIFATNGTLSEEPDAMATHAAPFDHPVLSRDRLDSYPRFSWSIYPTLGEGLFDPRQPLRIQLYASLDGSVELLPGLSLEGEYQANIYDTFSNSVPAMSLLPHVRTDVVKYLTKGRYGFSNLMGVYRARLAPTLFGEIKAGYLENMYAGVGAQLLWRPDDERWSLGADIYQVWKRNFDRLFGLRHYHVLTGHVTLYYRSPWDGLNFNVHVGRYLAGDYGATFEVSRRFMTDVEVGAYVTFTNVPFKKFGEGSFDKGIFVRVPLEALLPFSTQSSYNLYLPSLTRDGGQRLIGDDSLYADTMRTSYDEITRHGEKVISP